MQDTITPCVEEEYSLCPSYFWRRRSGWRPLLIYFRGPAGVPFFIAPLLTLLGLWRFARPPLRLADAESVSFHGATVTSVSANLGSYGMGGPGFVGLRLRPASGGKQHWIVFTIWAAAEWLTLNDSLLADGYFPEERRELTESGLRSLRSLSELVGRTLLGSRLEHDSAELTFSEKAGPLVLRLQADSSFLPVHRGSKQPKVLAPSQDVRNAVVTSRRASLWLGE